MKKRNHNQPIFSYEKLAPLPLNDYGSRNTSYRRSAPLPSRSNGQTPPPYNRSAPLPSRNNGRPSSSYRRSAPLPSRSNGYTPSSYRRPAHIPSHGYGNSQPSYRRQTSSQLYYQSRSPKHSYKNSRPKRNIKKKISISAFFLIITAFGLYGAFSLFNPASTNISGDPSLPSISITSPSDGTIISSPTVPISWTASGSQNNINYYEIQIDSGSWTNVGNSLSHTYTGLSDGVHSVVVRAWDNNDNSNTETVSFTIDTSNIEKIAVFFWASDAGAQWVIDEYIDVLGNEGYTKFFDFRNTNNFESDFQQVANYEDSDDIIFFYLFGHGNNDGQHSFTAFSPGGSVVYSHDFRVMCDSLDSSQVGLLVESCHSGDWSDDMRGGGYLAISTSDENHNSYAVGSLPNEGIFTDVFFDEIDRGSNAINAFPVAENAVMGGYNPQYPKLCDESTYNFFGY